MFIVTKVKEITEASASVGLLLATAVPLSRAIQDIVFFVGLQFNMRERYFLYLHTASSCRKYFAIVS